MYFYECNCDSQRWRCRPSKLSSTYSCPSKSFLDPFIEHFEKKLSPWKSRYFLFGGRVALRKSTRILWFILCWFFGLAGVIKWFEKSQRDFLRNKLSESYKYHLVGWNVVRKPLQEGGIDHQSLRMVNATFLSKRF